MRRSSFARIVVLSHRYQSSWAFPKKPYLQRIKSNDYPPPPYDFISTQFNSSESAYTQSCWTFVLIISPSLDFKSIQKSVIVKFLHSTMKLTINDSHWKHINKNPQKKIKNWLDHKIHLPVIFLIFIKTHKYNLIHGTNFVTSVKTTYSLGSHFIPCPNCDKLIETIPRINHFDFSKKIIPPPLSP